MKTFVANIISSVFGLGLSPVAPGTVGALAGLLSSVIIRNSLSNHSFASILWVFVVLLVLLLGTWASTISENKWGKDPQRVVIDEFAGIWISVSFVPISTLFMLLAFILFRFFDIVKPFGIKKLEKIKGGLGIMADDILAGVYTLFCMQIIVYILGN